MNILVTTPEDAKKIQADVDKALGMPWKWKHADPKNHGPDG